MNSVDSTATVAGVPAAQPPTARVPKSTLDQGDFLRLLTAQLQNQDPTKPVDNFQYVQQMAMFAQIEGGSETNAKLDAVVDRLDQLIARISPPEAAN
ncbi:flagellar hook capping FlgD N-terminal domain-containing protein [Sandarakinorhabdus sp. AAP62]|uniref:flagellar hook assembly protein FlgD n=1 Tax=Sandarakinorhabdus sp. AAP62 TaxID=1248916 RepID=UPI00030B54CD|nr:flagellar hook capping FlgD N-terminal domain-containing protein [Sandarakinorhabdus sp. AAP62]